MSTPCAERGSIQKWLTSVASSPSGCSGIRQSLTEISVRLELLVAVLQVGRGKGDVVNALAILLKPPVQRRLAVRRLQQLDIAAVASSPEEGGDVLLITRPALLPDYFPLEQPGRDPAEYLPVVLDRLVDIGNEDADVSYRLCHAPPPAAYSGVRHPAGAHDSTSAASGTPPAPRQALKPSFARGTDNDIACGHVICRNAEQPTSHSINRSLVSCTISGVSVPSWTPDGEEAHTMSVLVVGATGATGRLLVRELLARGKDVRAIVRTPDRLPEDVRNHSRLSVVQASVLNLSDAEMAQHVADCTAIASCLGHNLTLKGLFGPPHRLVADTTRRLCEAVQASRPERPVRFVLMNTVANRNRDLNERVSVGEKCVVGLLRLLLPPQADNEKAAEYLRTRIGRENETIQWVAVRPDTLIGADTVTAYDLYPSPIRSGVFNPGKTSRSNVAHFMAELIANDETWSRWEGQMPVIYNKT